MNSTNFPAEDFNAAGIGGVDFSDVQYATVAANRLHGRLSREQAVRGIGRVLMLSGVSLLLRTP